VSEEQVKAYVAEHPEEFKPREEIRLSWIVTQTKREAEDVLRMAGDGEDFATLARTYSFDEFTSGSGGDLGLIDADDPYTNENVRNAAADLEVGEIGGPVKTDNGWAVIQLTERQITSAQSELKQEAKARKELALSLAPPLKEVEDRLLASYEAITHPG
jgi:foldase protein PrsA